MSVDGNAGSPVDPITEVVMVATAACDDLSNVEVLEVGSGDVNPVGQSGMCISVSDEISTTLSVCELFNNVAVGVLHVSKIAKFADVAAFPPEQVNTIVDQQCNGAIMPLICTNNVVGVNECTADVADTVGGEMPGPNVRPYLLDPGFVLSDALNVSSVASKPVNLIGEDVCLNGGQPT